MQDTKTIIDKVKELVFSEESNEVEAKFIDATTKDGETLRAEGETFEVGASLVVVTEEGETQAPEGSHELEDGTILVVNAEGVITEITEAVEEEEVEEEMAAEEVNPLEERVNNLESYLTDLLAKFNEVNDKLEKFASQPAEDELKDLKKPVQVSKRDSVLDSIAKYRK